MEDNKIRFIPVGEEQWRQLRGAWLDMSATHPSDEVESLDDAIAMTGEQWRERARALSDIDCFAEALTDESGRWLGFVSGYFDDLARDRHAFVSHMHALSGDVQTEARLLQRAAVWAGLHGAEALVVGIPETRTDLLIRYEDHGFRRTGVRRRCDLEPARYEVELAFDLAASALAAGPHVSLRTA